MHVIDNNRVLRNLSQGQETHSKLSKALVLITHAKREFT